MTTVVFYDSFSETEDTALVSHTPDTGTGWVDVYNTTGGEWVVYAANGWVALNVDANNTGIATRADPSPSSAEYDIYVTLARGEGVNEKGTKPVGVFFRRVDNDNLYLFQQLPNAHAQNSQQLYRRADGVWTQLASADTSEADGDAFHIEVRDDAKRLYKNDELLLSTTDNTLTAAGSVGITNGNFNPAGGHARGVYAWDDFQVTVPEAGSVLVALDAVSMTASNPVISAGPVSVPLAALSLFAAVAPVSAQIPGQPVNVSLAALSLAAVVMSVDVEVPPGPVNVSLAALSLAITARKLAVDVVPQEFAWYILVDWDGDGQFANADSDISARVRYAQWRLGMRRAFQNLADEAEATIELVNTDGRYSPDNPASPLAGLMVPGRRVLIMYTLDGFPTAMYAGFIESIEPWWHEGSGAHTGKQFVTLHCLGWKQALEDADVAVELQYDKETQAILQPLLNSLGIVTDFQGGRTVFPVYGGDGTKKVWQVAKELTEAERGRFFQARTGAMVWRNRHWMLDNYTVRGIVSHTQGQYKPAAIEYQYGQYLSNSVRVRAYQRTVAGSAETLWELQSPLHIPPGQTRELIVSLQRSNQSDPAATLSVTPAGVVFSSGTASINVVTIGSEARITIQNAGLFGATLAAMRLEGTPTVALHPLAAEAQDTSVEDLGVRGHRLIDLRALSSYDEARQIALYEIYRRGKAFGAVDSVTFRRRANGIDNRHMLEWTIGDRIAVDNPSSGGREEYFVVGEEHTIEGPMHEATLRLEPADPQRYWLLGVAGYSELGQTTIVGY